MVPLRIAPYRQIAHEIATRLAASREGSDPIGAWQEEVIVPSRGVADAITAALVQRMPNGIAGLRLHTPEELAKQRVIVRTPEEAERRLAMRVAVRTIDHPMMESRGVASMLERAYRDVRDSGLALHEFAKRVSTTRGLRNPKRTDAIVGAWREYERLIAQLDAIDAADRLRRVNSDVPMQLLAGFYDMTGAQLALVQSLLDAGRIAAIWVPTEEPFAQPFLQALAPWSDGLGHPEHERGNWAGGATGTTFAPQPPRFLAHARDDRAPRSTQYDSRTDELRDVTARVAALLAEGTPASEIGIVARALEPYDARLLNRFAEEYGFATTLTEEMPLSAHRIGRGAMTLLRLRERGFLRAEVLELLRDGLHVKARISIDDADASTRRARVAGGVSEELRKMRTRDPIIADYIAVVAELETLTANLDLDFISRLSSLFRIETDTDLAAAEILDRIAAVFRRTAVWNRGFDVTAVLDAIEHESLSRQPTTDNRQPIWAGDVMRFRGRSFTHLFVVRMQDDVFPQRRTEDPLLPDSDRRLLRLREIGDGREEEQLLFSLLGDASPNVYFSFATGDGFGKVLRKSRYLRACHPERSEGPGRVGRVELPHPRGSLATLGMTARPLQLLAKSGTRSVFDGYIGALTDTLREKLTAVSPTQLEDFGECPQKFLLKHLLGVTELDAPERELQIHHREKGSIDHRILEGFYRHLTAEDLANAATALPRLPDALGAKLDALIDAQFDAHESVVPPFNRTVRGIERRATKRILREFLATDLADLDAQELVPRWFEYRFGAKSRRIENAPPSDHPDPFLVDAGGVPVRVEGTIDRIDMDRDPTQSRYRIVDYKSGKALRHVNLGEKIDRGVRLQLALYAMAVAEFFEAKPEQVSGTIKPIVVGEAKAAKFAFALHEKRDALVETLEIFVRSILSGEFPAFPNDNDAEFNSCKYCPVNHSCRTRHDLDERYAVQQQKDPRTLLREAGLGGRA